MFNVALSISASIWLWCIVYAVTCEYRPGILFVLAFVPVAIVVGLALLGRL